ncbi:hypothetical protein [Streptomyces sp. NPDC060205]
MHRPPAAAAEFPTDITLRLPAPLGGVTADVMLRERRGWPRSSPRPLGV